MVGIIIPVYNTEQYIERCISSLKNQTYDDFSITFVDDGSSDWSGSMCDEYAQMDSRIIVIHSKNEGQSTARNKGLALLAGEYTYFCDSDDSVEPTLLADAIHYLKREKSDILWFQCFTHADGKVGQSGFLFPQKAINIRQAEQKFKFILNYILTYKIGWGLWLALYRTSILQENKIRFPKGINIAEDLYFLILMILSSNRVSFLDKPLYHYHIRCDSTMGTNAGRIRVDEKNELLYQIYQRNSDGYIRDHFFYWHDMMMQSLFLPMVMDDKHKEKYNNELKKVSTNRFFQEQVEQSRKHLKWYWMKTNGLYMGIKKNILNGFFANQNYVVFRTKLVIWEAISFPFRMGQRVFRYIWRYNK